MSLLVCPLCGKSNSVDLFDPSDYALDIYVYDVRGLGRGRGFDRGPQRSILGDDEITPIIKDRVLDIVQMLIDNSCLTSEELSELEFHENENEEEL